MSHEHQRSLTRPQQLGSKQKGAVVATVDDHSCYVVTVAVASEAVLPA